MTQAVMEFSRNVRAAAAVTAPTVAWPDVHKKNAHPTTPTIKKPFNTTNATSIVVKMRISFWNVLRAFSMAVRAYSISLS